MVFNYRSCLADTGNIQVEVSQREQVIQAVGRPKLQTLVMDSITQRPVLPPFSMNALGEIEAYAEKVRAALTRKDPAIRDLFDIDFASQLGRVSLTDHELLELAAIKIAQPGNTLAELDEARTGALRTQLETQLRPVLRLSDYRKFDFPSSLARLDTLRTAIAQRLPAA